MTPKQQPQTREGGERERLLKLGHCPWDIEPEDEGEPLPEPHCRASRDGDCDFAYCPQPLLREKGRQEQPHETDLLLMVRYAAGNRCMCCGWPLGENTSCRQGDCGYRPSERASDHDGWLRRMKLIEAALAATPATSESSTKESTK